MAIFLAHLTKDPMINVRPQLIFYATAERFKQFCCNGFSVYRGVKGTVSKRFLLLQDESTEWWQVHTDLIELLFLINQLRSYFRIVNITGSPVFLFIAVENFFCKCLAGNINFPVISRDGRKIQNDQEIVLFVLALSSIRLYCFRTMVEINPLESINGELIFVERWFILH